MASARLVCYKGEHGEVWRIRLDYVDPATGERRRPWETLPKGTTKKQAEARMRQRLTELGELPAPSASKMYLGSLLVEWLERDARGRIAPTSLRGYERTLRVHLVPTLGMIPLSRLTPALLTDWQHRYGKDHGAPTLQLCHIRLSQALRYAVRMGYLARSPMEGVRMPAHTPEVKQVWTPEECSRFLLTAQGSPYAPIWHFLLGTGCRRGEALGLRWSDVDEAASTATISQSVVSLGSRGFIKRPKTAYSIRQIPLSPELLSLLKDHAVRQAAYSRSIGSAYTHMDLVFANTIGTPVRPNNLYRDFLAQIEKAGVPRISIHGLRHTTATLALEGGEPMEVIRQLLGHKRIATTADIYARVKPPATMRAAQTIQRLLKNQGDNDA